MLTEKKKNVLVGETAHTEPKQPNLEPFQMVMRV